MRTPFLEPARAVLALLLLAACPVAVPPAAWADSAPSDESTAGLSSYWPPAISRWEWVITPQAEYRGFDPDLIAALTLAMTGSGDRMGSGTSFHRNVYSIALRK